MEKRKEKRGGGPSALCEEVVCVAAAAAPLRVLLQTLFPVLVVDLPLLLVRKHLVGCSWVSGSRRQRYRG